MGDHANQPGSSTSALNPPRQPYIPWEQQRLFFLERMAQKQNSRQKLFVKNVPQESATRIAGLYTGYKPLETKNLYPDSRITTLMIALPSIGATDEALCETNGRRVGNTIITVERYNPKQSLVARRDARNKRSNFPNNHTDEEYYNGHEGDEEVGIKDTLKATKLVAKQSEPEVTVVPPRTRRVGESCGISWANIAGGLQPEQQSTHSKRRSPSIAAPAKADTPQQDPGDPIGFQTFDHEVQPVKVLGFAQSPTIQARASTHAPPPGLSTITVALPPRQSPPQIASTPTTAYLGPFPTLQQSLSTSTSSDDHFYTASEHLTPPQGTQTQSSKSSRVEEESSQQTQDPDMVLMQPGMLAMPSDTTAFARRHCADCAFCRMRMQSKARANHQVNERY